MIHLRRLLTDMHQRTQFYTGGGGRSSASSVHQSSSSPASSSTLNQPSVPSTPGPSYGGNQQSNSNQNREPSAPQSPISSSSVSTSRSYLSHFEAGTVGVQDIPGICGIKNHGNTCFMNAIIQCLSNTDLLAEYLVMNHYRVDLMRHNKLHGKKFGTKGELTEQLAIMIKSLWSGKYTPDLSQKFKTIVAKYGSQYEGSEQHDAQEFLLWLLDKVHEDLNIAQKKKYKKSKAITTGFRTDDMLAAESLANHLRCNNSFIQNLFQAQLRSSLVCRSCGKYSNTFDPYLCLSLPVPTRQTHTFLVHAFYLNKEPREIKIGVSIESYCTLRDLRDKISRLLKIPEKQLVLLTTDQIFGLKELSRDTELIQEILDDSQEIKAVETPKMTLQVPRIPPASASPLLNEDPYITAPCPSPSTTSHLIIVWTNRVGIGSQGSLFGSLYSAQISREASYKEIQREILKAMSDILKNDVDLDDSCENLSLRMRVIGGLAGKSYLPDDVDHPLYMPTVDRALSMCEEKDYRGPINLKMVVEWDLDLRLLLIVEDHLFREPVLDSSIEYVKQRAMKANRATLEDCFELYFREEKLGAENAWMCPSCRRKQHCIKKLSLWSVPDVFIVHLKRFRQSSNAHRSKLTTLVVFPLNGLDMSRFIVPRKYYPSHPSHQGAHPGALVPINDNTAHMNGQDTLWSPWKKPRLFGKNCAIDDYTYDLYAVCNHDGTLQSGHYTTYSRSPIDGRWYSFDDTKVAPVSDNQVVTQNAYILFYQKSSLSSAASCASSSTSGYSSASSFFTDHWAFRMPHFNHFSPKSSKSQDDLALGLARAQELENGGSSTTSSLLRSSRGYSSLPFKGGRRSLLKPVNGTNNDSSLNHSRNLISPSKEGIRDPLINDSNTSIATSAYKNNETSLNMNDKDLSSSSSINNMKSGYVTGAISPDQSTDKKQWTVTSV